MVRMNAQDDEIWDTMMENAHASEGLDTDDDISYIKSDISVPTPSRSNDFNSRNRKSIFVLPSKCWNAIHSLKNEEEFLFSLKSPRQQKVDEFLIKKFKNMPILFIVTWYCSLIGIIDVKKLNNTNYSL